MYKGVRFVEISNLMMSSSPELPRVLVGEFQLESFQGDGVCTGWPPHRGAYHLCTPEVMGSWATGLTMGGWLDLRVSQYS